MDTDPYCVRVPIDPTEYSDAQRLHWYACPPDTRRGELTDYTAEVVKIGDNGPRWIPLAHC